MANGARIGVIFPHVLYPLSPGLSEPWPSGPRLHRASASARGRGERVTERTAWVRSTAMNIPRSGMWGAGGSSRWRRSSATSQGRHPINRTTPEKQGRWCEASRSISETSGHDRPIFMSAGPDGFRPRCGGRDSRVGGPEDNPRRFSHVCMKFIDRLNVMPNWLKEVEKRR